jgi:hypothetical protein
MTTTLRTRDPGPELPGLVEALDSASAQPFDLVSLRLGVDGLVRHRRRRRRQVATASGAAAAVLVAGGLTWTLRPGPDTAQVAQPPATSTTTTAAPPAAVVTPPPVDRTLVPDEVLPTAEDVGFGRELVNDLGQYADVPVVDGQECNQGLPGLAPDGGRAAGYFDPADPGAGSVDVTVTVFAAGTGPDAFTEAITDTGRCRWVDDVTSRSAPWDDAARFVVQGEDVFGAPVLRAVARSGDVLVGVEVVDVRGANQAQSDAQRLADLVLERARASMPAARD